MIRVNILCEGPTEEQFVKKMLYPHFIEQGIMLTARSLGGGFSYQRLKHQIIQWLNNDQGAYVCSKRILSIAPKYDKVAEGLIIAQEIGLPTIRAVCPHFNRYCLNIEQLALGSDVSADS